MVPVSNRRGVAPSHQLICAAIVVVAGLALVPATSKAQTAGFAVLGDSTSDEYRADNNRGGEYAATTLNWLELLERYRGVNVGSWGTREYPRRTGYEFNWARSGARAADVIGEGQAAGVAAQVAAGQVSTVVLMIGANDFAVWNGTFEEIYSGALAGAALDARIEAIAANIRLAIETVQAARPVTMLVATVVDRANTPNFLTNFPDPARRQFVTDAILAVNARIRTIAAERNAFVADLHGLGTTLLQRIDANGNLIVGGEAISLTEIGNEPHHLILGDNEHGGTVSSGLLANLMIETLNSAGWTLATFTDAEMLENAGIEPPDTEAPAVTLTAPADGADVSGNVVLSATASDNGTIAGVQFVLDGVNIGAEDTVAPYERTWATGLPQNGTHTLTAIARDADGNRTTATPVTVTVRNVDTTAPTVQLTAPSNGAQIVGTLTVSATASDNVGVAGVTFMRNGQPLGPEDTQAPYSISVTTSHTQNGSWTITAVARDAADNQAVSAPRTVTVNNPVPDTTPPTVAVTNPAAGASVAGTTTLSASATDNVGVIGVRFQVDGANVGNEDTSSPFSVSWSTAAVANGPHTVTAIARDAAGNTSSASVAVAVANPVASSFFPGSYLVTQGTYQSGTAASLVSDDNSFLVVRSVSSGFTGYTRTELTYPSTPAAPTRLEITVVAKSTTSSTSVRVYAYRVTTSSWVQLNDFTINSTESSRTVSITSRAGDYRDATGTVRLAIQASKLLSSFTVSHEMVRLNVTQ